MNDNFNFRLQRVLDYRGHVKDQKSKTLIRYKERLSEEKNILSGLCNKKDTITNAMDKECTEGVSVDYLTQCHRYTDRLKAFIDRQSENVSDMEKKVEECRVDLTEASIEKEMLDRLRERHYQRFAYHLAREQEKQVEDLINNRKVNL